MLAVIETGGKQFIVSEGDKITVEKLSKKEGEKVIFERILLTAQDGKTEIGTPFLDVTVKGKVVEEGRGKKIRVFKMKAKKRYQKTQGHRQDYSTVEITKIGGAAAKKEAPKTVKKEGESAPKKKAAPKKKPVAKKAPAKKTTES